jgi:MFS transporter, OFA family, oxalate/formate antiporter
LSGRLYHGWIIVGGAFVVLFLAYGTQYAFGVFFAALLAEFHWGRASLSGAFSLYAFVYSAFGLVAGRLTDRWGPRAVIAGGGLLLGAGLAGMSLVNALWQPYVLYGGVAALGMSTVYVPCNATVVRWFVRRRGLAVGLASAGGSLGTFVLPPVAHWLVSELGWRRAYLVFGAAIFLALAGVALLMRRDPESLGLHPDGVPAPAPTAALGGWTVRDAVRTRAFWVLFAIFGLTWIPVFIPLVHLVPLARDLGIDALRAATLVSALGIAAVAGRLSMGWLSDRIGRRAILGVALAAQASSFVALGHADALPGLAAAALLFGFSYGTVSTIFPAMVADFFGRAHAGALVGLLFGLAAPTAALGPVGAGWIYDRFGGYGLACWLSAGINLAALALLGFARAPRARARDAAASSARIDRPAVAR